MFNKPAGYLTAASDAQKPTVMQFFPPELRDKIHPVGRLDMDTHGLLLFTDDSRVDRGLLLPERHAGKIYKFRAIGKPTAEDIERLESGVRIGESTNISKPAKFTLLRTMTVSDIKDDLPEYRRMKYLKNPHGPAFEATLEIFEGRKHEVKLMLRAIDCKIMRLERIEFAGLKLDPTLREGEYRPLNADELFILQKQIKDVPVSYTELQRQKNAGKTVN